MGEESGTARSFFAWVGIVSQLRRGASLDKLSALENRRRGLTQKSERRHRRRGEVGEKQELQRENGRPQMGAPTTAGEGGHPRKDELTVSGGGFCRQPCPRRRPCRFFRALRFRAAI